MPRTLTMLFAAPLLAPPAHACLCAGSTVSQAFESASAVFQGRAVAERRLPGSVRHPGPLIAYTLTVSRVWKGAVADTLVVRTPVDESACGMRFDYDRDYLVYAYGQDAGLYTDMCMRTAGAHEAWGDLCQLPPPIHAVAGRDHYEPSLDAYIDYLIEGLRTPRVHTLYADLVSTDAGHDRLVPELIAILQEGAPGPWLLAIKVLGSYGYDARPAIPLLLDFVCHERRGVRAEAWYTLSNICPEAEVLFPVLGEDSRDGVAAGCAEAVEKLRAMTFDALPPDSLRAQGGRTGPLFMIRMERP